MEAEEISGRVKSSEELERIYRGEYLHQQVTRSTADGRGRMDSILLNHFLNCFAVSK